MWAFQETLQKLEAEGLLRKTVALDPLNSLRARVGGRETRIFCSNDYLGLNRHPEVIAAAREALEKYGSGSVSARQVAGDLPPHRELESKIAQFLGTESALLFSSGYLANLGVIPSLLGEGDFLFSDSLNHGSLIDACRLSRAKIVVYRHGDLEDLESKLRLREGKRRLIVSETLFSMDGDIAPMKGLSALAREYNCAVFFDEAHGLGVLGKGGRGGIESAGIEMRGIDWRMGTASKFLASQGAFVAGSQEQIEILRNFARTYLFDTALAPSSAAAATAALTVLEKHPELPEQLREKSLWLRRRLATRFPMLTKAEPTPILPLPIGDPALTMRASRELLERGVYVQGIRPPTVPQGTSRLRLTVSVGHSLEDLEFAAQQLETVLAPLLPV